MSLDAHIRVIAREEAERALSGMGVLNTTSLDAQGLQQQITDLHEHLHHAATTISRLDARLDALEKQAGQAVQEAIAEPEPGPGSVRRARRKTVGE